MQDITITDIQILPVKPKDGLMAFCNFTLNNQFHISSVAIFLSLDGQRYRLSWPLKVLPNGKKIEVIYPLSADVANKIREAIIEKYMELLKKVGAGQ